MKTPQRQQKASTEIIKEDESLKLYPCAWNSRISEDQHAAAARICRELRVKKSDLARTALAIFLEIHQAAGRIPGAIERIAIADAAEKICRRSALAARGAEV